MGTQHALFITISIHAATQNCKTHLANTFPIRKNIWKPGALVGSSPQVEGFDGEDLRPRVFRTEGLRSRDFLAEGLRSRVFLVGRRASGRGFFVGRRVSGRGFFRAEGHRSRVLGRRVSGRGFFVGRRISDRGFFTVGGSQIEGFLEVGGLRSRVFSKLFP